MLPVNPAPPGRSPDNPVRPLGEELLEVSDLPRARVADRAKAVAVLRKADEFMRTENPAPTDSQGRRRALELAAGRIGVLFDEYVRIVRSDPDLAALERRVIESALFDMSKG